MVMMKMTRALTRTIFISPDYVHDTTRLSCGLLQPQSTASPVSTASTISHLSRASPSTVRASQAAASSASGVGV